MQEFCVRADGFNEVKKRLIVTMTIICTVIFLVIVVAPALMSDDPARFDTLPYMAALFFGIFAFSVVTGIKRQRRIFESLKVKIDHEKIIRESLNTPPIIMKKNELRKITKHANGSFSIHGQSKFNPILIPAQIQEPQLLEQALNQLHEIAVRTSKSFLEKLFIPISLSGVLLMGITFVSKNDIVILMCSTLVLVILTASLILTQLSKNIDKRTKRLSWLALLPLAVVLNIVFDKLF